MYSNLQLAQRWWLHYTASASGKGHGIHSPFVFSFIEQVLNNKSGLQPPRDIEALRKSLANDKRLIPIVELGAGSRTNNEAQKSVAQIAATAVKPKRWGHLLYRLACWQQPGNILELGTSLGITTAYLAKAWPDASLITIEGNAAIHANACANFARLGLGNIRALQGSFDERLSEALQSMPVVDLGYIDGNHRYQPTLEYFQHLLLKKNDGSIFIFDDIHWSAEMEQAWNEIRKHPEVHCSVDLFFMGFVFFNPSFKVQQHFSIRTPWLI